MAYCLADALEFVLPSTLSAECYLTIQAFIHLRSFAGVFGCLVCGDLVVVGWVAFGKAFVWSCPFAAPLFSWWRTPSVFFCFSVYWDGMLTCPCCFFQRCDAFLQVVFLVFGRSTVSGGESFLPDSGFLLTFMMHVLAISWWSSYGFGGVSFVVSGYKLV